MSDLPEPSLDYQWVVRSTPDCLVVQFAPLPLIRGTEVVDGMRSLFTARGFTPVASLTELQAPAARGCALSRVDESSAELVVQVGGSATRIAVPHGRPAWSARVFAEREVLVLLCGSAIEDGDTDDDRLQRDADAGLLLAARVPAGDVLGA